MDFEIPRSPEMAITGVKLKKNYSAAGENFEITVVKIAIFCVDILTFWNKFVQKYKNNVNILTFYNVPPPIYGKSGTYLFCFRALV